MKKIVWHFRFYFFFFFSLEQWTSCRIKHALKYFCIFEIKNHLKFVVGNYSPTLSEKVNVSINRKKTQKLTWTWAWAWKLNQMVDLAKSIHLLTMWPCLYFLTSSCHLIWLYDLCPFWTGAWETITATQ